MLHLPEIREMLRSISLLIRTFQGKKEVSRTIQRFREWQQVVAQIAQHTQPKTGNILIVRLDDIGDYLLFRNTLEVLQVKPVAIDVRHTLLGNIAWRDLFLEFDANCVNDVIWVDKKKYFDDIEYRKELWSRIASVGFDKVVCPSRSRSLLLDDICMLAAGAIDNIAGHNTLSDTKMNTCSDSLYSTLLHAPTFPQLEFFYNSAFAEWCWKKTPEQKRPSLHCAADLSHEGLIIGFIGGSKKSHLWPIEQWKELMGTLGSQYSHPLAIAGGKTDAERAGVISANKKILNLAGQVGLVQLTKIFSGAKLVITHDTMAAHLAISLNIPTVIIANGDNFQRFCAYEQAGITGVRAVYPDIFLNAWKKHRHELFTGYKAVTSDIARIRPAQVLKAIAELI